MNQTFKSLFWLVATALMVVSIIFVITLTGHIRDTAATTNTISFSGEGKVSSKPDVGVINFSIITQGTTSKAAQDDNSKKSQAITSYLKGQGIADKDIKTTGYNVYPQYDYQHPQINGTPHITGYQVTQTIELKVRDLNRTNTILDGLVSAGANEVSQVNFKIDNPEALKDQARQKAIADAKQKASNLESQLGISLGRIVNFQENDGGTYPVPLYLKAQGGGPIGAPDNAPSLPSGENDITIDVTLTYQIR